MAKLEDLEGVLEQLGTAIGETSAEVEKVGGETSSILNELRVLRDTLTNPPDQARVDAIVAKAQGLVQKMTDLGAKLKAVDDLVPDAAPAEPAPTEEQPPSPEG